MASQQAQQMASQEAQQIASQEAQQMAPQEAQQMAPQEAQEIALQQQPQQIVSKVSELGSSIKDYIFSIGICIFILCIISIILFLILKKNSSEDINK
jgi:predicted PurR-regulated permease PerM